MARPSMKQGSFLVAGEVQQSAFESQSEPSCGLGRAPIPSVRPVRPSQVLGSIHLMTLRGLTSARTGFLQTSKRHERKQLVGHLLNFAESIRTIWRESLA